MRKASIAPSRSTVGGRLLLEEMERNYLTKIRNVQSRVTSRPSSASSSTPGVGAMSSRSSRPSSALSARSTSPSFHHMYMPNGPPPSQILSGAPFVASSSGPLLPHGLDLGLDLSPAIAASQSANDHQRSSQQQPRPRSQSRERVPSSSSSSSVTSPSPYAQSLPRNHRASSSSSSSSQPSQKPSSSSSQSHHHHQHPAEVSAQPILLSSWEDHNAAVLERIIHAEILAGRSTAIPLAPSRAAPIVQSPSEAKVRPGGAGVITEPFNGRPRTSHAHSASSASANSFDGDDTPALAEPSRTSKVDILSLDENKLLESNDDDLSFLKTRKADEESQEGQGEESAAGPSEDIILSDSQLRVFDSFVALLLDMSLADPSAADVVLHSARLEAIHRRKLMLASGSIVAAGNASGHDESLDLSQ